MLGKPTETGLLVILIIVSTIGLGIFPAGSVNHSNEPIYTDGSGGFLADPAKSVSTTGSDLSIVKSWNVSEAVSDSLETASNYQSHAPIYIGTDASFTLANGVTGGSGTFSNPYIIEGWSINASRANGIEIRNTNAYFIIRNVQVHSGGSNFNGIFLGSANNGVIQDVVVYDNYRGVFVWLSSHVTMWGGKTYLNNGEGVSLLSSSYATVAGLNISTNRRDGVRVFSSSFITFAGNIVSSNVGDGVALFDSSNVTAAVNQVKGNGQTGISVSTSVDNSIYHNYIWGNVEEAYDDLSLQNMWDGGYPAGGNRWSNYSGQDVCNGPDQSNCTGPDGIGDIPYVIDPDSQDRYPLMASYQDISSPTWPPEASVMATNMGTSTVTLAWTRATDNVMVLGYRIYQGGTLKATLPSTIQTFTVTGLTPGTTYTFKVEAGDEVGNWSLEGPAVTATTLSVGGGGGGGRFFLC